MVGFQECVTGTIILVKVDALRRLFPLLLWYSCVYNAYPNFYNADMLILLIMWRLAKYSVGKIKEEIMNPYYWKRSN